MVLELILLILLGVFTLAVLTVAVIGAWSILRNSFKATDDDADQG